MRTQIPVTNKNILSKLYVSPSDNPVANSIRKQMPESEILVDQMSIRIDGKYYMAEDGLQQLLVPLFYHNIYGYSRIPEFTFEVDSETGRARIIHRLQNDRFEDITEIVGELTPYRNCIYKFMNSLDVHDVDLIEFLNGNRTEALDSLMHSVIMMNWADEIIVDFGDYFKHEPREYDSPNELLEDIDGFNIKAIVQIGVVETIRQMMSLYYHDNDDVWLLKTELRRM